jgi:hypothetical protein
MADLCVGRMGYPGLRFGKGVKKDKVMGIIHARNSGLS